MYFCRNQLVRALCVPWNQSALLPWTWTEDKHLQHCQLHWVQATCLTLPRSEPCLDLAAIWQEECLLDLLPIAKPSAALRSPDSQKDSILTTTTRTWFIHQESTQARTCSDHKTLAKKQQSTEDGSTLPGNFELHSIFKINYRSLMEQGIVEGELILLRFKYLCFFDINPKVRT